MRKYRAKTIKTDRWAYGWFAKVEGKSYIILDDAEVLDEYGRKAIIGFVEIKKETVELLEDKE